MALKKPSDLFKKEIKVLDDIVSESDTSLSEELSKIETISSQVNELQQKLSQKIVQTDLERMVFSQINTMREKFQFLQNDIKSSNKTDIHKFREQVLELTHTVENILENELPKYKRQVSKTEVRIDEKFNDFKDIVEDNIITIKEEIDSKVINIYEVVDNNLESFNNQLQETSSEVKKTTDTYNKLSKILENKVSQENEKLSQYSQIIENLREAFDKLSSSISEEIYSSQQLFEQNLEFHKKEISDFQEEIESSLIVRLESYNEELTDIKTDVVINEQHIKNVDKYLQEHHQELVELKEEVFGEIYQIPVGDLQDNLERLERKIDYIKETYSKIEPEVIVKEVIREGLLNEPPDTKNSDPLTPLDQNFVTLDQLQNHYRLFLNRIQQQLSTLGGGGETRLKYLDDIVGIATNASAYDGKFLKYDHGIGKFVFDTGGGGGGESYWASTSVGIHTLSNVGIGTTNPTSKFQVVGDTTLGNVSISSGIISATSGIITYYGDGSKLSNIITGIGVGTEVSFIGTGVTSLVFTGNVLPISSSGGIATVTIPSPQKSVVYYIATEGQTIFVANYTVGYLDVFLNGVKLSESQYTATSGSDVVLETGASSGDVLELIGYTTFNLSSSYASNAGIATYALVSGYASNAGFSTNAQLADVATLANTVSSTIDINTSGIVTASTFSGSGSNLSGIVTNITAGDNITISASSGNVTINASGGGGNWISSGITKVYTTSSVGIGILNPSYNLDVFGNINFTGTLFQNGTAFSGSKWIGDTAVPAPIYRLSDVGIGITNPIARLGASSFTLGNVGHSTSGILTTTTTTTGQVLDSMPTATFRTARYQVSIACTGQLVGSASSSSTVSISGITAGTFYIPGTYTDVPLTGGSGSDVTATITVTGTSNNVGFTTAGNLLVTNTQPHNIGTNQPIKLAANVPNSTLTGTALTTGTIYYATGIGTTAFTVAYTSGGATVAIGVTTFTGVGNTVTISGGVTLVSITSPGSGYGIGNTLTASEGNLGSVGSGFTCSIGAVVSNYQSSDLMILQSVGSASTSCDYIEYASLANNDILGTFGADISGSNARLLFSPTYRNNTIKLVRHSVVV